MVGESKKKHSSYFLSIPACSHGRGKSSHAACVRLKDREDRVRFSEAQMYNNVNLSLGFIFKKKEFVLYGYIDSNLAL